ncbi:cell elongation-specific peptidoglycan biosynthesis regulator RodA [Desulfobulbus propionicus DSM 2032]|uniref:Peptidoglycan glycosyltransferase RodA n=1 Tax=Desulfobulbus propionicus (strain ATCC 33891 / DSM 2032 / VKM B-1956 / 1pr3) TaxID=577650 RepID=A0A7U3YK88_DESPD|nr:rod shape-determining protein RodA [Desulfobulbus propionicus]ADW16926.1 cell elongation-specific peptidoglycan biosynthesis regulator RodA [Desulfobulbus propionicus DSM 2032]
MFQFDRRLLHHFDWVMLLMLLLVGGMALTNLYSSTYIADNGASSVFYKQLLFFSVGLVLILVVLTQEYQRIAKFGYALYAIILALLIYTLLFVKAIAGSQRWIDLGFFNLQPSEPAKLALILVLASCYAHMDVPGGYRLRDLIKPVFLTALPFVLIMLQPDLGTALICAIIFVSMTLFVRLRWSTLGILSGSGLACIFIGWKFLLKDYQRKRIETFLNPEGDPMNHGYQIMQSKIAVGSGKVFGKGFMEGTQGHLHFLPERHTDFAFSVWAEEWGFAGSLFFLSCYFFMLIWGINIAMSAKDKFGSILAFGCIMLIFWQAVINLFMIMGFLPVVGVPLPLFSYGGSSLLTNMVAIGILMNVRMRSFPTASQPNV